MISVFEPESKFKTTKDLEGVPVIPCRMGGEVAGQQANIYQHGPDRLAFVGRGVGLRRKLLAIDGVKAWQTGDEEFSVVFPPTALKAVGRVVRPLTKRRLTPAHLEKLRAGLATHRACSKGPSNGGLLTSNSSDLVKVNKQPDPSLIVV